MAKVDIKELFESGAHFGHKTSRWHPKMAPFIHSKRGGVHIIDLEKTVEQLETALSFIEKNAAGGKQLLLVGTKRQVQPIVEATAKECGNPYVSVRWLGGMLTNHKTMNDRVKHMKKLEEKMASGELADKYNKLEVQRFQEEIDSLKHVLGGVENMEGTPGAVFVFDVATEKLAVSEAKKLGIPVIGIVDTNANPEEVDYPIAANDDAIKALKLIGDKVAEAVNAGKSKVKAPKKEEKATAPKKDAGQAEEKPTKKEAKKSEDK